MCNFGRASGCDGIEAARISHVIFWFRLDLGVIIKLVHGICFRIISNI